MKMGWHRQGHSVHYWGRVYTFVLSWGWRRYPLLPLVREAHFRRCGPRRDWTLLLNFSLVGLFLERAPQRPAYRGNETVEPDNAPR